MIYIISNGQKYNNHQFFFVNVFDNFNMQAFLDAMHEEFKRQRNYEMTKWTIAGTCENLCVLDEGSRLNHMTIGHFLDHINAWVLYPELWVVDFKQFLNPPQNIG